jgi:hypothetical protein
MEARERVRGFLRAKQATVVHQSETDRQVKVLVTELVRITGNPRDACWRFARQLGVSGKQTYRFWSPSEEQKLLDLIALNPLSEVARMMRRSEKSLSGKLHKLGATAQMGFDWFTASTLAKALHIRAAEVNRWIEQGWLRTREVQIGQSRKKIIEADAFAEFCRQHGKRVVGRRLNAERLDFVQNFVFPPSHAALLPVRERGYKKGNKSVDANGNERPSEQDRVVSGYEPTSDVNGTDEREADDIAIPA